MTDWQQALANEPDFQPPEGARTVADERYLRPGFEFCLAHAVEECGEFTAAAGKLQRWGPHSVNPELDSADQETNIVSLRREMGDVRGALDRLEQAIEKEFG